MTDNIVFLRPADNPDIVLDAAKGIYESLVIVGWNNDGELDARATTNINEPDILWLIESLKAMLLNTYTEFE